ncbi:unnamed protein product [Triticum turgidum subsp. durum]|uniref:Uncharacterized protein n=1 Tax=Triticum turgidum subsp. durum TaxID=4567 RepID=A0A9R0Q4G2_TRITD|nr:unnamed protein product [Triticum turgidum subsp. durum]
MRKKLSGGGMDATVDELSAAYKEFVAAAVAVMEAREQSGGQKMAATDAALEAFNCRTWRWRLNPGCRRRRAACARRGRIALPRGWHPVGTVVAY